MERREPVDRIYHNIVNWSIHNYFQTLVEQNTSIESPEFITNFREHIKWQLSIIAKRYDGEKHLTECILRRSPSCNGPRHIDLRIRLALMDSKCEFFEDITKDLSFYPGTEIKLSTRSIFHRLSNITASGFVAGINIYCDILQDIPLDFKESDIDADLRALSKDLKAFYRSDNRTDLHLKVGEERLSVHRLIVKARSPKIAQILDENRHLREIDLTEFCSAPLLKGLIVYWYSADLDELPKMPNCFSAVDIKVMEQLELAPYVYPDLIEMTTTFKISNTSVSWAIEDFQFCENLRHLQTDIVHVYKCDDLPWKLHIYPKGTRGDANYFTLDITEEECVCLETAYIEVFLKDEDCKEYYHKRQSLRPGKPRKYVFFAFLKHGEFYRKREFLLKHNILRIGCRIIYPTGGLIQDITAIRPLEDFLLNTEHPYINLVNDMKRLYKYKRTSDISLKSGNKIFRVHSAILAARSRYFQSLFTQRRYETSKFLTINMDDVESDDLDRILKYIYYAEKIVLSSDRALRLYPVFYKYKIKHLENLCINYLQNNLSADNVFRIIELAKKFNITPLERIALQFARENWGQIQNLKAGFGFKYA